jgi:hypothetical protein
VVRWVWQNRLVVAVSRFIRLFTRWLLVWLDYLLRMLTRNLRVSQRMTGWLIRPRNPNNLFVAGLEASHHAPETALTELPAINGNTDAAHTPLLWAAPEHNQPEPAAGLDTTGISLWAGSRKSSPEDGATGAAAANRRFAYLDVLATQIKRLTPADIDELEALIQRLARKWLDVDDSFEWLPRRNRLDIGRTLRHNIPRYAGRILNLQWATKERPIPQMVKPAKILLIGDVSHSMVQYVSILLYFFHKLNFRFVVDSYIFSEKSTHSSPFLNGVGTFEEKVERLIAGAKSWNAGTRFGSALEDIAATASVDENTYVIIATDGKVSLQGDEVTKIDRCMKAMRRQARQVIFLTPSMEFSAGASGNVKAERLGSFKSGFMEIPIFAMGPPLWYGTLAEYADRLYLIRTVQDLIDMTEDLILSARVESR